MPHVKSINGTWQDHSTAFTEADRSPMLAPGEAAQDNLVAIAEESALLAGGKPDYGLSAGRCFKKTAATIRPRARDGARPKEIAGAEIDTADRVMGDELRDRPIEVAHVGMG